MYAKFAVIFALVAMARAGVLNAGVSYASPALAYGAAPALAYGAAPALAYGASVRATPVYRQAPAYAAAYAAPAYAHGAVLAAPAIKAVHAVHAPVVAKAVAIEAPQPYEFGYSHHTDDGAASSRQESSDANNAKHGSYSIQNPDGTYRHVEYVADELGFRATVKTNEHGTAPQNPAATQVLAEEPPYKVLPAPAPIVKAVHAAPIIAKAVHAAPVYAHAPIAHAAPVYAHAPIAHAAYHAPIAHATYAAPALAHATYAAPALAHAGPAYYH